jgi:NTP pyrophosphatase (non-canonical NTP hydrolase)
MGESIAQTALEAVARERLRQDELVRRGKFSWNCAFDGPAYSEKLAVLMEEVGEVAREVTEHIITRDKYTADSKLLVMPEHREEHFRERLKKELIQVAAVCVAWVEHLSGQEAAVQTELEKSVVNAKESCVHDRTYDVRKCQVCDAVVAGVIGYSGAHEKKVTCTAREYGREACTREATHECAADTPPSISRTMKTPTGPGSWHYLCPEHYAGLGKEWRESYAPIKTVSTLDIGKK